MEKIPNIHKIRQIMYPESEIYTLQDMMEEEYPESPLDDALWEEFRNTGVLTNVDKKRRNIELTVDADAILMVSAIQSYTQKVSDIVEKVGGGKIMFVGIQGGVDMRIGLVYRY